MVNMWPAHAHKEDTPLFKMKIGRTSKFIKCLSGCSKITEAC